MIGFKHHQALGNGDATISAIAEHAIDNGHQIDWNDAMVIDSGLAH